MFRGQVGIGGPVLRLPRGLAGRRPGGMAQVAVAERRPGSGNG
ncbi:hypothetical protein ABZ023_15020 [Streptomyces sp. NPDC006367]